MGLELELLITTAYRLLYNVHASDTATCHRCQALRPAPSSPAAAGAAAALDMALTSSNRSRIVVVTTAFDRV